MERMQIIEADISPVVELLLSHFSKKLENKGSGILISTHEILGIITEEYYELIDAVRRDNKEKIKHELIDLGICIILALISMHLWKDLDLSINFP